MNKTPELYDIRNKDKQTLQNRFRKLTIKVWDIRNCKVWVNLWSELSKDDKFIRPVIILKTNIWWDLVLVAPLTSIYKKEYERNYIKIDNFEKYGLDRQSYVLLNQIKTISSKRLVRLINNIYRESEYIPLVDNSILTMIKEKYKKLFWL